MKIALITGITGQDGSYLAESDIYKLIKEMVDHDCPVENKLVKEIDPVSERVSVVISTYNRYKYLLHAIKSVKEQTYKDIEIIVVNDRSTQKEYYEENVEKDMEGVRLFHLEKNSREVLGYPCMSLPKNYGMEQATGEYIAFLDDDDYWMPTKIEKQINEMKKYGKLMSSTDGYVGNGLYNNKSKYKIYNREHAKNTIISNTKMKYIPKIFTLDYINKNNTILMSSTIVHRKIFEKAGKWDEIPLGGVNGKYEDWELWKKCLKYTDSVYLDEPLIYYDMGHGDGKNY